MRMFIPRSVVRVGGIVLLLICGPITSHGQEIPGGGGAADSAIQAFLEVARASTERYQRRNEAIRDGYRLLGPDFPGMGEHWIHPGLLIGGRFDPARPQVLAYARVAGEPTLVGVAYALPLAPGETPPEFPPGESLWHDHSGSIDEESVLLNHVISGDRSASGHRLTMLHAWIWMDNPDGVFTDNNWTLPYRRLGIPPPESGPVAAAKALSLVTGGDAYYLALFRALGTPGEADDEAFQAVLARGRRQVEERLDAVRSEQPPTADLIDGLVRIWEGLSVEVERNVSPEVARRLSPVWALEHAH
jgi:hypothetical protein